MDTNYIKFMLTRIDALSKENKDLATMLEPKRVLKERFDILNDVDKIKSKINDFCEILKLSQNSFHTVMIKDAVGCLEASVTFMYNSSTNGIICYPTSYSGIYFENGCGWKILFTDRGITKILSIPERIKNVPDIVKIRVENFVIKTILKGFNLLEEDLYKSAKEDYERLKAKNENLKKEVKNYE